jgi:hypothetical protein
MPKPSIIRLPHHQEEHSASCLPALSKAEGAACVAMVLSRWQVEVAEARAQLMTYGNELVVECLLSYFCGQGRSSIGPSGRGWTICTPSSWWVGLRLPCGYMTLRCRKALSKSRGSNSRMPGSIPGT